MSDLLSSPSVRGRQWRLRAPDAASVDALARDHALDPNTARLLSGRGVGAADIPAFLAPRLRDAMPDPSVLQDMDAAARAVLDAMEGGKRITVFADYDVDGGTSAAQLLRWARHWKQDWGLYVPDRVLEGYGPSREAFEKIKARGQDLVITVDCGAAAKLALEAAEGLGLEVVVIDHHLMDANLPPARALVNPNRPDDESDLGYLAAAGVTFLLLVALNREARARGLGPGPKLLDFLGLAALGTVCDVVPLVGLNRALVTQGLKVLSQRREPGVRALAEVARAQKDLAVYDLGFLLGPRINAGGRIGEADMGAKLLAYDEGGDAWRWAKELDRVNTERRALQDNIQREALAQAARLDHADLPVLVLASEDWHPGIIGIVAGRLKEKLGKPVILVGGDRDGGGKGSGRSIKGVNLGGAIAGAKAAGLLKSGGGHAMAGGLSLEWSNLAPLREHLADALSAEYAAAIADRATAIDLLLSPPAIDLALLDRFDRVGPFGSGNPKPSVVVPDVRVTYADRLKGGHIRCTFEDVHGHRIRGIAFRAHETGLEDALLSPGGFGAGGHVHVQGTLKRDRFRGEEKVDFHVSDIAPAEGPLSYT